MNLNPRQTTKAIHDLVCQLEISGSIEASVEICGRLMTELEILQKSPCLKENSLASTIHETGIRLWNVVIAKKTGKKINKIGIAQGRHVALHLTYIIALNEQSQTAARKQQAMAMKCGKDWLDCGNITMAENSFVVSTECYMKLHKILENENGKVHATDEQLLDSHSNMIQVYLYRADLALRQCQYAAALFMMEKAKELVHKHQLMAGYFFTCCYNFGLDCYQKELYLHSRDLLELPMDSDGVTLDLKTEVKAMSKQLLALVYVEMKTIDSYEKALEVIEQSILEQPEARSIHMKIKIKLLLEHDDESILRAFSDLSIHPALDINLALQTISLLCVNKRFQVCYGALEVLNRKYTNLQENVRVQLKKLEILLSNEKIVEAKDVIKEELIRLNNHGNIFAKTSIQQLQLLIWEQANKNFEGCMYEESLYWYDCSSQFMRQCSDDPLNLSKLQRNRAACFIELQQYTQALEAIEEARKNDEHSPQVYSLLCKVSLAVQDDTKAIDAIKKMSELQSKCDQEIIYGLVCLNAQLAFEKENRKVAEIILEVLVEMTSDSSKEYLIPIRCLTRLKFAYLSDKCEREDVVYILHFIDKAHQILKNENDKQTDEVMWFNKIAWNLALSCSTYYAEMERSFLLCYELSLLLPDDMRNASQQKTCLLMAVGCSLQTVRANQDANKDANKKEEKLNTALSLIDKCYEISKELEEGHQNSTMPFLMSYEFETKAQLGRVNDLDSLLEKSLQLQNGKTKTLESFANVALTCCKDVMSFGIKALKLVIKCYLEQENINLEALSKAVHSLISVSLQIGSNNNAESKEDAYNYFEDTLKVVENVKDGYPEMELVWLMTKAWNCGIHLYSAQHFDAAEKWCSLSMKFLKFLKDLKDSYEPHMSGVFTDIISKIQQSRVQMQVEE